jgi:homocitrate synthase NifV
MLTRHQAEELLPKVRAAAVSLKRTLFDKELVYIFEDYYGPAHGHHGKRD